MTEIECLKLTFALVVAGITGQTRETCEAYVAQLHETVWPRVTGGVLTEAEIEAAAFKTPE